MKRGLSVLILTATGTLLAGAAELKEAHVTQVVHDVKVLGGRAVARPATVNDAVRQGDAVRTGQDSRAELTFVDLTITRLGANTVFSFNEAKREVNLDSGALLLSVPRDGAAARINTAAATAAISGGTAMCEANKGFPFKVMVLEGNGHVCSVQYPTDCEDAGAGEMITTDANGKLSKPTKFNVGLVYKTARLLTDFPPLPNDDLIQLTIDEAPLPDKSPNPIDQDAIDQHNSGSGQANLPPAGNSGKFGPPATIASPNPYVIDSSTQIQTDPTITTNGQTDMGKIFRSQAQDGSVSQFLFGSTRAFDGMAFQNGNSDASYAVFKFAGLQLAGDPTISTTNGGEINLALVSVGDITSATPGGTLTFAGIDRLFIGTQDGSINFGPEIEFDGPTRIEIYARGAGSNLFMGAGATADVHIHLFAEGDIDVENELTTASFKARSGGDFFIGKGSITADDIDIGAGHDISFHVESISNSESEGVGNAVNLDAGNILTLNDVGNGEGTFGWDSLTAHGDTVNLNTVDGNATFDFSNSSFVTITAGTGGINASDVDFLGSNLTLQSDGDISIGSAMIPISKIVEGEGGSFLSGSITAAGTVTASGDIQTALLHGGDGISTSGAIDAGDISAGDPLDKKSFASISADQGITAEGGSIVATGDITSTAGGISLSQEPEGTFGNIHAGGNISSAGEIFTPGTPAVVFAGGTISAPAVVTGTLHGVSGITIDNTAGDFNDGIIANNVITGGTLQMINVPQVTPNNRTASGGIGFTPDDFLLQAGSISSSGDTIPFLQADGDNAADDPEIGNPGNGGKVTVDITAGGLTIGQNSGRQPGAPSGSSFDLSAIEANGGDFADTSTLGGDGGEVHITTTGDVNVDLAGNITATTGRISDTGPAFAGKGGTVTVDTPGQITVNGFIQVSSAEPTSTIAPSRRSASGGNIALTSTKSTGVAISVGSSGQLLALLDNAAPGPGGKITILANGSGSSVDINNQVEADRGTVDIRQTGTDGVINLANNGNDMINIRGDIVKIGALGTNGTLNIGSGTISADTLLKLYAGGSNGTINFNSSVTLDGNSTKIIAANTVNIFGATTVVTIGGNNPADVYTQHPNYTGSGGNGTQAGTFGGAGANAPITTGTPPPFGPNNRSPRTH